MVTIVSMPKSLSNASQIKNSIFKGEERGTLQNFLFQCPKNIAKVSKSHKAQKLALKLHKAKCDLYNSPTKVCLDKKFNRHDVSGNKVPTYGGPK